MRKFLLIVFLSLLTSTDAWENKIVVLIPFNTEDTQDEFFEPRPWGNFWTELKMASALHGYTLTTTRYHHPDDLFAVVTFNAPSFNSLIPYRGVPKVLFIWEPPCIHPHNFNPFVHEWYDRIVTWQDDRVDGEKYHKFNYALAFHVPKTIIPFHEKKLCCMFVGNKSSSNQNELYSERLKTIDFLETHAQKDFDFYGPDWSSDHPSYRGYADNKIDRMQHYKFPIVYENTQNIQGYITEKLFDAFSAGCVPVYWGAPNITQHIPSNTFIAREDFEDTAALYAFLSKISEEEYNIYLSNIAAFLRSEQAHLFSRDHFIKTFLNVLDSLGKE